MNGVIKNVEIDGIEFKNVFLNEDFDVAFRYSSKMPSGFGEHVFKIDEGKVIMKDYTGRVERTLVLENGFGDVIKKALINTKTIIMNDLRSLSKRFAGDLEPVIAFDLKSNESPFLFTSKTLLDKSQFSPKYNSALLYNVNQIRKKQDKTTFKDLSDMFFNLGKLLKKETPNLELKQMGENEQSDYYEVELSFLASL